MEKNFRDMNRAITTGEPSNFVDGLYVKDGRLINGRPNGMTGIQQAANMKRIIDEDRQIKMIADGIERSEMRKKLFG